MSETSSPTASADRVYEALIKAHRGFGTDTAAAVSLAAHLRTLLHFHFDDADDEQAADPIGYAELIPDRGGLVVITDGGQKFIIFVGEVTS